MRNNEMKQDWVIVKTLAGYKIEKATSTNFRTQIVDWQMSDMCRNIITRPAYEFRQRTTDTEESI